jgi:ectoine hydroxylase-related dioxygenase (phytanoyl-CoA dioxygenase family)
MTCDDDPACASVLSEGFYIWRGFQDPARCTVLRDRAEQLLRTGAAREFPTSTRLWELYRYGNDMVALMCDEGLLALAASLLGPYPILADFSLNQVRGGEMADYWHIDYPFSHMRTRVTGSLLGIQCIMPLSPFTADNGATQLVPGTHRREGHPRAGDPAGMTTFIAGPGDLLVIAAATWHRSGVNTTATPRTAVLFSFVENWIRPMTGPPEPGAWSTTPLARSLLGFEHPTRPESKPPVSPATESVRPSG